MSGQSQQDDFSFRLAHKNNQDLASAHVTPIRQGYFFSAGNRVSIG
jgi:hypothetical protein